MLHHQHLAIIELRHGIATFGCLQHQLFRLLRVLLDIGALKQKGRIAELRFGDALFGCLAVPFRRFLLVCRNPQPARIDFRNEGLRGGIAFSACGLARLKAVR